MSKVVGNPEELERFARNLKQFNTQLRESMSRLKGQFVAVAFISKDPPDDEYRSEPRFQYRSSSHRLVEPKNSHLQVDSDYASTLQGKYPSQNPAIFLQERVYQPVGQLPGPQSVFSDIRF